MAVLGIVVGIIATVGMGCFFYRLTASKRQVQNLREEMRQGFGRVLAYLDGLPSAPKPVRDAFEKGRAAIRACRWNEAVAHLRGATDEAAGRHLVALFNLIGNCFYMSGRLKKALEAYEESARIAVQLGDEAGQAAAAGNMGLVWQGTGELAKAQESYEASLRLARDLGDRQIEASMLGNIGVVHFLRGEFRQALAFCEDSWRLALSVGDRRLEACQLGNIGNVWHRKGELDKAIEYHQKALAIDRAGRYRREEALDLGNIGAVLHRQGNLADALGHYRQALAVFEEMGMRGERVRALTSIGRVELEQGALSLASSHLHTAAELLNDDAEVLVRAEILGTTGFLRVRELERAAASGFVPVPEHMLQRLLEDAAECYLGAWLIYWRADAGSELIETTRILIKMQERIDSRRWNELCEKVEMTREEAEGLIEAFEKAMGGGEEGGNGARNGDKT